MIIKTDLNVVDYYTLVDEIAFDYFDDNGEYQPHVGIMNTMRLFYNRCVVQSKFDNEIPHDNVDAVVIDPLLVDDEFIKTFNQALAGDGYTRLDFANAYKAAMDIVNVKKASLNYSINLIKKSLLEVVDVISPALSQDNIAAVAKIAQNIARGEISSDAVVKAYANQFRANSDGKPNLEVIPK